MKTQETAPLIFDSVFLVQTPAYETISMEEIEERGTPTTLDGGFDRALMSDLVSIHLPIAAIATRMNEGSRISLPNDSDILRMYRYIELHLEAWKEEVYDKPFSVQCPAEDLILLDKLADAIYYRAMEVERMNKLNGEAKPIRRIGGNRPRPYFLTQQFINKDTGTPLRVGYSNYFRNKVIL